MNLNIILLRFKHLQNHSLASDVGESIGMALEVAHGAAEVIAGELQGDKELASAALNARVIQVWLIPTPKSPESA